MKKFWTVLLTFSVIFTISPALVRSVNRLQGEAALRLVPHRISLQNGKTFNLNLPEDFEIRVAAEGLKRVRFMAKSPDDRIFVTDMHDLSDNRRGVVYILQGFDRARGRFSKVTPYLSRLRNPNSIAFYTDANGRHWFYLALTDRLLRFAYVAGERAPASAPETLATFPDYGLSYKYGGWHLTRTVTVGGNDKIYVSVGSSCNACEEKEAVRATILEMDADGSNQKIFVRGLRNAVGIKWIDGRLFATDMGADHLGNDRPSDTMYALEDGRNYGWPFCYQYRTKVFADAKFNSAQKKLNCASVPRADSFFSAHSSPLGFEYFGANNTDANLRNRFLVALHGSSKTNLNRGYRISLVRGALTRDFINGFLQNGKILGRPVDVMNIGADAFLFTDDHAGAVYYVFKRG